MSATDLVKPVAPDGQRWTDWLLSFVWVRVAIYLVAIRALIAPLFVNGRHLVEHMDEHQFHGWELTNKITLLRYHQLPAWNPYWCGGTLGVAAPEDIFFAPDNLLRLFFDVEIARHLSVLLGLCMAAEGAYRLSRAMGSSAIASLGAAFIFATNPMLALWTWVGFFNFVVGFGVMPWVGWCALMGVEKPAYRYLGAFLFAWIFLSAGTYPAPYTLMLIGYLTACMAVMTRGRGSLFASKPFVTSAVMGVVFVLLVLVKFVPLMLFLKQFSRTWNAIEQHGAPEIFSYLGANHTVLLVLAGAAVLTRDRWAIACALGAGIFFALSMGDFDPLSPYHLLKELPLFKQLRSPERHVALVFLFVALGAARAVTFIEDAVPKALASLLGARSLDELPRAMRVGFVALGTVLVALALGPRYEQMVRAASAQFGQLAFTYEPRAHVRARLPAAPRKPPRRAGVSRRGYGLAVLHHRHPRAAVTAAARRPRARRVSARSPRSRRCAACDGRPTRSPSRSPRAAPRACSSTRTTTATGARLWAPWSRTRGCSPWMFPRGDTRWW
jgi:hypothetical protein